MRRAPQFHPSQPTRATTRNKPWTWLVALLCCFSISSLASAEVAWKGAHWIWGFDRLKDPPQRIPAQGCRFRAHVAITERSAIRQADLLITADNLFEVSINGQFAGSSNDEPNDWNRPKRFNVAALLTAGDNTLAIEALNTAPGPAGLIACLRVVLEDGTVIEKVTDASWRYSLADSPNWRLSDFDAQNWRTATELAIHGDPPWHILPVPTEAELPEPEDVSTAISPEALQFKGGILFVGDDCSLQRPAKQSEPGGASLSVTVFTRGESRAFPEHDLPGPIKVGHRLFALYPAGAGAQPLLLLDAGRGGLGSPTVSYDGNTIFFSMAREGDAFFHLYRMPAGGGRAVQLTFGPFHDIDPVEMPDGSIAFTSTRCGYFEEYHNTPSRALFTMAPDGSAIRPLTSTFIFDNEPKVLADGRLLFIRSDNFFDRGKVETLLHAVHPDGSHGYTEFGLDLGPGYGNRLRAFFCGSPAPLPDGRVAFVTGGTIAVGRPGSLQGDIEHLPIPAGEVAAIPDGRLLCTLPAGSGRGLARKQKGGFSRIAMVTLAGQHAQPVTLFESTNGPIHSPVYLGSRPIPAQLASTVKTASKTGVFYCQDARLTRNTRAGWPHIKAIRVLMGKGLTMRSSHSYIVHAGNETVELGTVPLAEDGSFAVEVPADTAIAFQAVDAEGRSELNEMSWIYVRPGETRGCVGCHAGRQQAPSPESGFPLAATVRPLRLSPEHASHRFRGNNAAVTGLTELQFDRFREVAGLNSDNEVLENLLEESKAGRSAQRIAVINRLAVLRDSRSAPILAACLDDPDRETRVAAAIALAACGTAQQIPALEKARQDADLLVRSGAKLALENLGGGTEQQLLDKLAGTDRDAIRRAAATLGHRPATSQSTQAIRSAIVRWCDHPGYKTYRFKGDDAKFLANDDPDPRMIQEIIRTSGRLRDRSAVPLLAETLEKHADPDTGNLFVAEAAADALGLIANPEAEIALIRAFSNLKDYPRYTHWYGDHEALMACHMSPVHYRILDALDRMQSTNGAALVPAVIRCIPTDFDRALFAELDAAEGLIGRFIRRQGREEAVAGTCLAWLGKTDAKQDPSVTEALKHVHGAWAGTPTMENRAAQVLSIVCTNSTFAPQIREAYRRYMVLPNDIPRVFSEGIPVVNRLPGRHWVCFYLGRALGRLRDRDSVDTLIDALQAPGEFARGSPDPLGPGLIFLHNDLTPCWRAAAAWALGEIGEPRAVPILLETVSDFNNATDTRHAAAVALSQVGDAKTLETARQMAKDYPEESTRAVLGQAGRKSAAR